MQEKNLEFYKRRVESAVDDGVVDYKKHDQEAGKLVNEMLQVKGKYKKLVAGIQLIKEVMPEAIGENLTKKLDKKDFSELPFKPEELALQDKIGAGFVSKVYLLESKEANQPSMVIKLDFVNYGGVDELQETAQQNHQDYESIKKYYTELPELVPEELSFITTNRKDKRPTIATIQQFMGTDIQGIFEDYSREDLTTLLEADEKLRNDFIKFVDTTESLANREGVAIDLIGERNLTIIKNEDVRQLKFLDPHLISSTTSDDEERNERLKEARNYLISIRDEITEKEIDIAA